MGRLVDVRAALAAFGLAGFAAVAVAVAIATHLPAPAPSAPATHATTTGLSSLQALPLQAQSVMSAAIGADSRGFAARRSGGGWQLAGGGVRADFRSGAPILTAAGGSVALTLRGAPVTSVTTRGNRVTLTRSGIREWYAAGPLGIEQGFTLTHRLPGSAVSLGVSRTLQARMTSSGITFIDAHGHVVLRYGGLTTVDASGHRLASTLAVRGGRVVIAVNDAGARYPITVDPLVQQGGKLVPNDLQTNGSGSQFGNSVALSADGNTAMIAGWTDNSSVGAVWVFIRSGGVWSQLGKKIVPSDESVGGGAEFGTSVALSAEGSTALIGGELDHNNGGNGAAWVYVRSGASYVEQQKLDATSAGPGTADRFGASVALSGDGNTAIVGGPDNPGAGGAGNRGGAAWVFSRSGATWTTPGVKIAPTVAPVNNNTSNFGTAVALSSDGQHAFIGGPNDNAGDGSVWVYNRSGSTWAPSGAQPLTATGETGHSGLGASIDLSADGTTAIFGGPNDNNTMGGAAWIFTGSGSHWTQQAKLVPKNAHGPANFGISVAISSHGNTALIAADHDSNMIGAAYIFTRSAGVWTQQQRLTGSGEVGFGFFGTSAALSADGQTALVGAQADTSETGAAFVFAPPAPVCDSVAARGPQGGGSVAISLSCTLPSGAHPSYSILGGPSNGKVSRFDDSTGHLVYTSAAFFSGQDSFTYRVSDQWGISNIATATLHIPFLPVPKCANVTGKGKKGATKVTLTLKCTGPKGHPFRIATVSKPGNGRLGKINQSNGKVTYTTHVGFSGKDRFVYNATNSGGSSKPATATIVLPTLGRITAAIFWDAFGAGSTSTVLPSMVIKNLPGSAHVRLSCTGKGCPIKTRTLALAKHRVCKGKGKKRKCRLAAPKSATLSLTRYVAHKRLKVGSKLIVAMIQPGSIGKEYVFRMVKNDQAAVKIQALAPGSTRLCLTC
ncbi:MAG: Ig-like domain-containing protein [Solirubrobacteraceae bacterium]